MNIYSVTKSIAFEPGLAVLVLCLASQSLGAAENAFREEDLVSDIPGRAARTDPNLVNPWGIAASATSPFWVANAGTGTSTLYAASGAPAPLIVTVPGPGGTQGSPTGAVFNGGTAFGGDRFIFSSEDGAITGWRGALGTNAEILVDNSATGAIYKGLAIGSIEGNSYLYASDFHNNKIDVIGSTGAPAITGNFMDPLLPSGYAPFNIQNIGGQLYVTYALQDAEAEDDVAGAGHGFINVFDLSGNMVRRLASNGALNSPWGLALAPDSFGPFGGNLIVGNFGNGWLNAYDVTTGDFIGSLRDASGTPLEIDGLWGLQFRNAFGSERLFFTAGLDDETHGLFGSIAAVPEPGTIMAGFALIGLCGATWWRRRKVQPAV